MFLATMLAKSQPYTSREVAARSLACYIRTNHLNLMVQSPALTDLFKEKCAREEWEKALKVWNFHIKAFFISNQSYYLAQVTESRIDQMFT